ncbi:hypothetical protein HQ563_02960 [bacterium]|nr:hypothetical protein [bacterium]
MAGKQTGTTAKLEGNETVDTHYRCIMDWIYRLYEPETGRPKMSRATYEMYQYLVYNASGVVKLYEEGERDLLFSGYYTMRSSATRIAKQLEFTFEQGWHGFRQMKKLWLILTRRCPGRHGDYEIIVVWLPRPHMRAVVGEFIRERKRHPGTLEELKEFYDSGRGIAQDKRRGQYFEASTSKRRTGVEEASTRIEEASTRPSTFSTGEGVEEASGGASPCFSETVRRNKKEEKKRGARKEAPQEAASPAKIFVSKGEIGKGKDRSHKSVNSLLASLVGANREKAEALDKSAEALQGRLTAGRLTGILEDVAGYSVEAVQAALKEHKAHSPFLWTWAELKPLLERATPPPDYDDLLKPPAPDVEDIAIRKAKAKQPKPVAKPKPIPKKPCAGCGKRRVQKEGVMCRDCRRAAEKAAQEQREVETKAELHLAKDRREAALAWREKHGEPTRETLPSYQALIERHHPKGEDARRVLVDAGVADFGDNGDGSTDGKTGG